MTTPNTRNVGANLRWLRKRAKKSLRALARESRVPRSTISDIELDKNRDPGIYTLRDLCKALGVTVDTLLTTDLRPVDGGGPVAMVTHHFGEAVTGTEVIEGVDPDA